MSSLCFNYVLFTGNTYDYDIALVKLKPENNHGIIFNDHVQPACLPQSDTKYEAGKKCYISGWGTTEDGNVYLIRILCKTNTIKHEYFCQIGLNNITYT